MQRATRDLAAAQMDARESQRERDNVRKQTVTGAKSPTLSALAVRLSPQPTMKHFDGSERAPMPSTKDLMVGGFVEFWAMFLCALSLRLR